MCCARFFSPRAVCRYVAGIAAVFAVNTIAAQPASAIPEELLNDEMVFRGYTNERVVDFDFTDWHTKAAAQLERAKARAAKVRNCRNDLESMRKNVSEHPDDVTAADEAELRRREMRFRVATVRFQQAILRLWLLAGNGKFITDYRADKLAENGKEICERYSEWLAKHSKDDAGTFLASTIEDNINALDSDYGWTAFHVLLVEISFESTIGFPIGNGHIWLDDVMGVSPKGARLTKDSFQNWYKEHKNELKWDAAIGRLVRGENGGSFKLPPYSISPDMKLTLKLQGIEAVEDKVEEPAPEPK